MTSILSQKQKKREKYTLSDLKTLGTQLLSSRAHVNNLPLLLTFVSPSSPPQHVLEAVLSLQSFFTIDLPSKSSINSDTDAESVYRTWLRSKFDDFVEALIDILTSSKCEETLREVVLDTIMELVKLGNGGRFNSSIYNRFLNSIVISTSSATFLLDQLESKYFNYIDVRYFTYASLVKITKTLEAKDISDDGTVSADEDSKSHSKARYTHPRERSQSRRLLVSTTTLSAHLNNLNEAVEESKKTVEASLRKAPTSAPNPTQNK